MKNNIFQKYMAATQCFLPVSLLPQLRAHIPHPSHLVKSRFQPGLSLPDANIRTRENLTIMMFCVREHVCSYSVAESMSALMVLMNIFGETQQLCKECGCTLPLVCRLLLPGWQGRSRTPNGVQQITMHAQCAGVQAPPTEPYNHTQHASTCNMVLM